MIEKINNLLKERGYDKDFYYILKNDTDLLVSLIIVMNEEKIKE